MAKIQLVLFDFDGTLVDTAPDLIRATNLYLDSQGYDTLPEDRIRANIGMGLRKLIQEVISLENKDEEFRKRVEADFISVYEREYLVSPRLFEGALEFINDFDGRVGIVSNKRERLIHPILKQLGIDSLPWVKIIGGDTYARMKPHPEPFLAAIEAAGVTPEETVIVGDGLPDVQGALNIGCPCVVVEHGYHPAEELMDLGAWAKIDTFHDLLPLLKKIT